MIRRPKYIKSGKRTFPIEEIGHVKDPYAETFWESLKEDEYGQSKR